MRTIVIISPRVKSGTHVGDRGIGPIAIFFICSSTTIQKSSTWQNNSVISCFMNWLHSLMAIITQPVHTSFLSKI